jgi:hypothetical protein
MKTDVEIEKEKREKTTPTTARGVNFENPILENKSYQLNLDQ